MTIISTKVMERHYNILADRVLHVAFSMRETPKLSTDMAMISMCFLVLSNIPLADVAVGMFKPHRPHGNNGVHITLMFVVRLCPGTQLIRSLLAYCHSNQRPSAIRTHKEYASVSL
jgi:hypothetical protein